MTSLFEPFFQCFYFHNDPTFVTLRQYFPKFVILYQLLPTLITLPSSFISQLQDIFEIIIHNLPIIFLFKKKCDSFPFSLVYPLNHFTLVFSLFIHIWATTCLAHVYPHELCILLFLHQLVKYTALCIFFSHICRYSPRHIP